MRPLELTVEGFRSYRDRVTFDWRGRRLVGVVGPVGAGKSSILDAISFALYGKTPTFERDTKSLIHQLSDTCHVELMFEVDGQVWRAQRALRRTGAGAHKLERLAADAHDAQVLEVRTLEREVRPRVEQLLGMGFDAFCRSVLLAQNRFSEFLKATAGQRNEVLKGVFGYERFDAAQGIARERAAAAQAELSELTRQREGLSQVREELDAAEVEARQRAEQRARLQAAAGSIDELTRERDAARSTADQATVEVERLEEIATSLPDGERLSQILDAATTARVALEEAEVASVEAEESLRQAEAQRAAVTAHVGDRSAFREFAALVLQQKAEAERVEAVEKQRARIDVERQAAEANTATARARSGELEQALAELQASLVELQDRTALAEDALHRARHDEMAGTLRAELVAGEPCPVCAQTVAVLPKAARRTAVVTAQKQLNGARSAEAKARETRDAEATASATAQERAEAAARDADRCVADLAATDDELRAAHAKLQATASLLVDRLGPGDPDDLLAAREAELAAAESHAEQMRKAAESARAAVDAARGGGERAVRELTAIAGRLQGTWGRLGETRDVTPEPAPVRGAFAELAETVRERLARAAGTVAAARTDADRASLALAGEMSALDLPADAEFVAVLAEAIAAAAQADQRVQGLRGQLEAGAELDERIDGAQRRHDLARRIASDLQPSRFLAYLLEEERAELAELGSVHLEELTNGAYRFTGDDSFRIQDVNAGATERSADSLSGGETFLASLALALALAEMVTRGGGRLDAFFLDEGFGSLDPEHLERAMDGIGRLVAGETGRLVVLVSHVEQMRQLLEDLIVLDKDDRTGKTVVVSGASPAA